MQVSWQSGSADETRRLGECLGEVLEAGDVIALEGTLGAGKTCFVQGLARGLGVPRERRVASPSFTLVNEHPGRVPLYHVDLYRLESAAELEHIGLDEYLAGEGVAAVEWFDRFPALRPADRLDVRFDVVDDEMRQIVAVAMGPRSVARLEAWRARAAEEGR
jgi:tRNA threonylcarbamoyladenosine biosynthesis protein TsaE